jgi:hypothetical protein
MKIRGGACAPSLVLGRVRSPKKLKLQAFRADWAGMSVETRLLDHWQREQSARRRARSALPERWQTDPRPEMWEVTDLYVELLAAEQHANVIPLALEDR